MEMSKEKEPFNEKDLSLVVWPLTVLDRSSQPVRTLSSRSSSFLSSIVLPHLCLAVTRDYWAVSGTAAWAARLIDPCLHVHTLVQADNFKMSVY